MSRKTSHERLSYLWHVLTLGWKKVDGVSGAVIMSFHVLWFGSETYSDPRPCIDGVRTYSSLTFEQSNFLSAPVPVNRILRSNLGRYDISLFHGYFAHYIRFLSAFLKLRLIVKCGRCS